jgi:PST family polysaccharide transporter
MSSDYSGDQSRVVSAPVIRRGVTNLVALAAIQVANALLPLVAYPLVLSVVGSERFSRIVVTESIMLVALALVIYSLDVEGVAFIAGLDPERDGDRISATFSDILLLRLLLLLASVVLLAVAAPFLDRRTLLLLGGWMLFPLGYILQSSWFFQGIEQNAIAASLIIVSRLACLGLIRLLIVRPDDFILVPVLVGGCYSAGGAAVLTYAVLRHRVRLTRGSAARAFAMANQGKAIFLGNLSVTLYRGSNVLILNAVGTSAAVATYTLAEKAIKAFQAGVGPLNQVFFPKVIRALEGFTAPSKSALRVIVRYTLPQLGMLLAGATAVALGLRLFHGRLPAAFQTSDAYRVLVLVAIMSPAVLFGVANFMFGSAGLNYLGRRTYFALAILITGLLNLAVCSVLAAHFSGVGAALSYALAEMTLFLIVARVYFVREHGVRLTDVGSARV